MFKLDGWTLIFTWGTDGLIFAKGAERLLIDKPSGEILLHYLFE